MKPELDVGSVWVAAVRKAARELLFETRMGASGTVATYAVRGGYQTAHWDRNGSPVEYTQVDTFDQAREAHQRVLGRNGVRK